MSGSETPIYDQVVFENQTQDPEGVALVEAIHARKSQTSTAGVVRSFWRGLFWGA